MTVLPEVEFNFFLLRFSSFMRSSRQLLISGFLSILLAACGGGGGSESSGASTPGTPAGSPPGPTPVPAVSLPTLTSITLQSEVSDPIGLGQSYRYSSADSMISVSAQNNKLVVQVEGDEQWTGVFQTGGNASELKVGEYRSLDLYSESMDASRGGLSWWGNGRSCRTSTGWVIIDNVSYVNGTLAAISLRFQRNCNGASAALRGEVKYNANDKTPPTPIGPAPGDLWRPPASVTASQGNYAYFESDEGDYLGLGKTYRFDERNARFDADGIADIVMNIAGEDIWHGEVRGTISNGRLVPGYYPGVRDSRFGNPVKGSMSWTVAGRGCREVTGWFAVDAVEYDANGLLVALDMRLEQHCEGRQAALRGAVHYRKRNAASGSGTASPAGSWRAPAAALPATGNYLYTESDPSEPIARGMTELQTSNNAAIEVSANGNSVELLSKGNRQWSLRFQAPARLSQIVPGVYEGLTWDGGDIASYGALFAAADGTGCNARKAWVVVDHAAYSGGQLVALDLRFEHACEAWGVSSGVLHGQLRWRAGVQNSFPGPAAAPGTFWRPAFIMPAGTYLYTTSDRSDFVGTGDMLFTPLDAELIVTEAAGKVDVAINSDARWRISFAATATAGKILPGYYAGLTSSVNPARGSFSWSGDGRSCNVASSGVVVDEAVYVGDKLSELKLRFEQHCEHGPGATRAQLHWFASDVRQPQGPQQQVPDSLWRAPAGALPDKGNYLYIDSGPGDLIGNGRKYLLTPATATMSLEVEYGQIAARSPSFLLSATSPSYETGSFRLQFQAMRSLTQLQPGFYPYLLRYPFQNTAFGGLNLSGGGRGCNKLSGWMVLDRVSYVGGRLSAVRGRFEQYCDASPQPARGEFNWEE